MSTQPNELTTDDVAKLLKAHRPSGPPYVRRRLWPPFIPPW